MKVYSIYEAWVHMPICIGRFDTEDEARAVLETSSGNDPRVVKYHIKDYAGGGCDNIQALTDDQLVRVQSLYPRSRTIVIPEETSAEASHPAVTREDALAFVKGQMGGNYPKPWAKERVGFGMCEVQELLDYIFGRCSPTYRGNQNENTI